MATADQRDRKIKTAQRHVDQLVERREKTEAKLREIRAELGRAQRELEWVQGMPIDTAGEEAAGREVGRDEPPAEQA